MEIYDSDGTLAGTVEIGYGRSSLEPWTPRLAIVLASLDEVWGTTFDEYEVPYIHRYRFDRTCAPQPAPDFGVPVGAVVVDDEVDIQVRRYVGVDVLEEAQELLVAVARLVHWARNRPVDQGPGVSVTGEPRGAMRIVPHGAEPAQQHLRPQPL